MEQTQYTEWEAYKMIKQAWAWHLAYPHVNLPILPQLVDEAIQTWEPMLPIGYVV